MSVYKKILEVMKDVEYLQKDDHIKFKETNYKAISEEKVTSTVRASLIKHGLVIIPIEQEHHREGILTTVNVKYKIVDTETDTFIEAVSSGTGVDTQDKGVGKAMTYAYKYLLLRTFAIPTGEDPDKISSAEWDAKSGSEPARDSKETGSSLLPTLKAKWQTLSPNNSLDGFDEWYVGQQTKGYNEKQMEVYLTKKLNEKKEKKGA